MKKFLICLLGMFICTLAKAATETINWYVDNEIYQTTTCSAGNDVTPPNAPAKRGYTFTGWRDTSIIIGTWAQSGSPTPDNPTYPTFYQDGDLILRAVGTGNDLVADIYSASTGIITRRIGVKVLDGTEKWTNPFNNGRFVLNFPSATRYGVGASTNLYCSHFKATVSATTDLVLGCGFYANSAADIPQLRLTYPVISVLADWKQWLADQYAAGTPVTIYYPLATPTLENYTPNANLE